MKALVASVFVMAVPAITLAQSTAPSSPSGASTSHQRSVTGSSDAESMQTPGGTSPADASTPHQRDSLKTATGASITPGEFVTKAGLDGMTEVQVGMLAQQKAQSAGVKKFAQQMVSDHTKANMELKSIAASKSLAVPAQLDPEHQSMVQALDGKTGSAFDATYISEMSMAHDKAIALFTSAKGSTDPGIAAFAASTLPTLQMHKQMLTTLQSSAHAAN